MKSNRLSEDDECECKNIKVEDGEIFFVGDIDEENFIAFRKALEDANDDVASLISRYENLTGTDSVKPMITLHLTSCGGSPEIGFAMYDMIKANRYPVCCIVEGYCSSAAISVLTACHVRSMTKHSRILVHQVRCDYDSQLKTKDVDDERQQLHFLEELEREILMEKVLISKEELDEIISHEWYLGSKDCYAKGFVDFVKGLTPEEEKEYNKLRKPTTSNVKSSDKRSVVV